MTRHQLFGRPSTGHKPSSTDGLVYECGECTGPSDFTHLCAGCRVGEYGEAPFSDDVDPGDPSRRSDCGKCVPCTSGMTHIMPCLGGENV